MSNRQNRILLAILICADSTGLAFNAHDVATAGGTTRGKLIPCVRIWQNNFVTGEHLLTISSLGLRDEYLKRGVVTIVSPPAWKSVTYNRQTSAAYTADLAKFRGYLHREFAMTTGRTLMDKPVAASGSGSILSFKTRKYSTSSKLTADLLRDYHRLSHQKTGTITAVSYQTTDAIKATPGMLKYLSEANGYLDLGSFVVECEFTNDTNKKRVYLRTLKIASGTVDPSEYTIPSGLKAVPTITSVFTSEATLDADEFFFK